MSSKFWLLILGLAVIAISSTAGRALTDHGAAAVAAAEDGGAAEPDNLLVNDNVETSTNQWEAEEWLKVSMAPEPHVEHKLGSPLDLECEILGMPPPQVKWIRGPYNYNSLDELSSNVVTESSGTGIARVRSRLILDHIPTVGEHRFTCVGQVGGQVVHATTVVKTTSTELFPGSLGGHNHRSPSAEILNHLGLASSSVPVAPRITRYYNVLLENIGSAVILPCDAYAQPHPQVYWIDNKDSLISRHDPRLKVLPDGSLLITNLKWDDMGGFSCVAKNDLGKDTKSTFLYPMAKE